MRMKNTNITILNALLAVDIAVIAVCMIIGERKWLYSSQIGYWSTALIVFASMASYRNMVAKRLEQGAIPHDDDRDTLDKIEDPYDLYSEEEPKESSDIAAAIKEEKAKLKANRRSVAEVAKDSKASLSPFRLASYGVLIGGFFFLNQNHYLHIPSYIVSLGLPMIVTVAVLLRSAHKSHGEDKA